MPQLALTDYQMHTIWDAAKQVPAEWRSRFLERIADELLPLGPINNNHVTAAVTYVLQQMHLNALCCDGGKP